METAIGACERFPSAFQCVISAGETSEEAMAGGMFETVGEA